MPVPGADDQVGVMDCRDERVSGTVMSATADSSCGELSGAQRNAKHVATLSSISGLSSANELDMIRD